MSVPEGKRSKSNLEVFESARKLALHTCECVANARIFVGRFRKISDELVETSWLIAEDIWTANNTFVGNGCDPRNIDDRLYYQQRAAANLRRMSFSLEMAAKAFKLPERRVMHWQSLIDDTDRLLRAWRESDRKRLTNRG